MQLLRDPDEEVRYAAADAVGHLGSSAATPEILAVLMQLLRDPEGNVRYAAVRAVERLGASAANPDDFAVSNLATRVSDSDRGRT
jgi:HEAT repeat protein